MPDYEIFDMGPVALKSGITLPAAHLAYQTYGALNPTRTNVILMPTFFAGQHTDTEQMMSPERALDPDKYFIIVPNIFGNGLSSSPSNTPPPFDGPGFPKVTIHDNVTCQHRLVTEHLGIERLRLVVGFSMGAQQAFHWAALYPDMVDAIAAICGTAKTSAHHFLLLEGAKTALTSAIDFQEGWYEAPPVRGMRAFSRVFASLVHCSSFYRTRQYATLGLASPADMSSFHEGFLRQRDANDLLAMLWSAQHADISDNDVYNGDLQSALTAIRARAVVMPCDTDFLCPVVDSRIETAHMPNAELQPITSVWGHAAGFGANPSDNEAVDAALRKLLAQITLA